MFSVALHKKETRHNSQRCDKGDKFTIEIIHSVCVLPSRAALEFMHVGAKEIFKENL